MAGQFALFIPALLKPQAAAMRALLWALWHGVETPSLPPAGLVSIPAGGNAEFALAMGWLAAGPVMIRLDIAEKLARELNYLIRKHPVMLPPQLASRMSIKPEHLPAVLNVLGFRIIPAATLAEGKFGPAAPPMLARRKSHVSKPVAAPPAPPLPDNPFAALAALKRA
jgi:ATP-dependent RNA helicase SUPV3L1/SUV3